MYHALFTGGKVEKQLQKHAASKISNAVTPASHLRQIINEIEIGLGKISSRQVNTLRNIPVLFDQAAQLLDNLEQNGADIAPEFARFGTVSAEFRRKGSDFLKAIGGRKAFENIRQARKPEKELWWWYIDAYLDEQYVVRQKNLIRTFLLTIGTLGLITLIYILFLAPDEATRARYTLQSNAESALAQGMPEQALEMIEKGLAINPDDEHLLILYGVAAKLANRQDLADTQFARALDVIGDKVDFLTARSQVYLSARVPELALADAQEAIEINPTSAIAYYQKGLASNALGDSQSALQALENAASLAGSEDNIQLEGMARIQLAYITSMYTIPISTATPID